MSKDCPIHGKALYLDCLDCETRLCKGEKKYREICIGVDQSYARTGFSVTADGKLIKVKSLDLSAKYLEKAEKRVMIRKVLDKLVPNCVNNANYVTCIVERIRLQSKGFMNTNYIKTIGALNATISDKCREYGIVTYSVDTRCWKAQVIGTSKPEENDFGVPEEKWPTVKWVIEQGFEDSIIIDLTKDKRKKQGVFYRGKGFCEKKLMYDNDAADSAGISMYWFKGDRSKLIRED